MPHSSGGGSHGGGSHGGSHGGSSTRTSHNYFPGSRRYRRHHSNGTDEYFYSNTTPQKTTKASIVVVAAFGAIFTAIFGFASLSSRPHQLTENYTRPSSYVYDEINVIEDDRELEDTLEEFNDITGICPVVYTCYESDCVGYSSLESYTMQKYTDNYSDERHFVIVYTIPEEQAELLSEGNDFVPDYAWEAVQGDDTDPILTEDYFMGFANHVQMELEKGRDPGEAFTQGFEKVLIPKAEAKINSKTATISALFPLIFLLVFFSIPLIIMVKSYKRDKDTIIEEVPLTEDDIKSGPQTSTSFAGASLAGSKTVSTVGSILVIIFLIPFILIGIGLSIAGAVAISGDTASGVFMLVFGLIWTLVPGLILVTSLKTFFRLAKKKEVPLTAEYPVSKPVSADYPTAEPQDMNRMDDFDMPESSASYRREEDEEYERMRRKGFE